MSIKGLFIKSPQFNAHFSKRPSCPITANIICKIVNLWKWHKSGAKCLKEPGEKRINIRCFPSTSGMAQTYLIIYIYVYIHMCENMIYQYVFKTYDITCLIHYTYKLYSGPRTHRAWDIPERLASKSFRFITATFPVFGSCLDHQFGTKPLLSSGLRFRHLPEWLFEERRFGLQHH